MYQVLLVEDNAAITRSLCFSLQVQGFAVTACADCKSALSAAYGAPFDLVLLDVMLPDGSGFELCRELHTGERRGPMEVIRHTLARILQIPTSLEIGPRYLHSTGQLQKGGENVELSALEFRILLLLLQNRGKTVPRETLFRKIWDIGGSYVNACGAGLCLLPVLITGGIHLGGMTLDCFLVNTAPPLGKQLRPIIVQGALMAAGSLVGKDVFPTVADALRHKLQIQSGERPFPFLFIREQVQIRCANGITDCFFSKHLISSVFSLHTGRGPQSHGRTF